jgi:hypothetical protein
MVFIRFFRFCVIICPLITAGGEKVHFFSVQVLENAESRIRDSALLTGAGYGDAECRVALDITGRRAIILPVEGVLAANCKRRIRRANAIGAATPLFDN